MITSRNDKGDLIMAFSFPILCNNNMIAEAQATKFGSDWCIRNGYREFILELDS